MTSPPIGTDEERDIIEKLRAFACLYAVTADMPEVGGELPEHAFNEAADALQSRISEVERLREALEFVRDWLANSRDVGANGWVPLDRINFTLSQHRTTG